MSSKLSSVQHIGASAAGGAVEPSEANLVGGRLKSDLTVNQKEAKAPITNQLYSQYSLNFPLTICCCQFHAYLATLKPSTEVGQEPNMYFIIHYRCLSSINVSKMLQNYWFQQAEQRRILAFTLKRLVLFLSWETTRLCGCRLLCVYQDVARLLLQSCVQMIKCYEKEKKKENIRKRWCGCKAWIKNFTANHGGGG